MKRSLALMCSALLGAYSPTATLAGDTMGQAPAAASKDDVKWTVLVPEFYDNLFVAGTITRLDRATGMVGLSTDAQGDINVQFRPEALSKLKLGQIAVVYLGYSMADRTISAESCDVLPVKVTNC